MNDVEGEPGSSIYQRLAEGSPGDRTELILLLIAEYAESILALPAGEGRKAVLDGVNLGRPYLLLRIGNSTEPPAWWDPDARGVRLRGANLRGARLRGADLRGADLTGADLRGATLTESDLRGARLEGADLRDADLVGAKLDRAALGKANLNGALLEDAYLRRANLRFADLRGAALEGARLNRADLWGADLRGAALSKADLRRAIFRESFLADAELVGADLRGAALGKADFTGADLREADLRGADLPGTVLRAAVLREARLDGLDLSRCDMTNAHLSGARLDGARLGPGQVGEALGEELAGQYGEARKGYLALERHYANIGDPDSASWAYLKRRRMQKKEALADGRRALHHKHWRRAAGSLANGFSDQLVEWLCDYGESLSRILGAMLIVYLLFTTLYAVNGSVIRIERDPGGGERRVVTRDPIDLAVFSLSAMTTGGNLPVGLEPADTHVHLMIGLEAFLGVGLTGLAGFILGNLVRR